MGMTEEEKKPHTIKEGKSPPPPEPSRISKPKKKKE
jgi:hypothetical protein